MRGCQFFCSHKGFSLTGTLVAVAIGGIVAALMTTVINEAVRGRRSVTERDEMSEFAQFLKNVLTADSTCTAVLNGKPFKAGGKTDLALNIGYGSQSEAVVKKGFSFADDSLEIEELSIEDRSPNTVQFKIGIDRGGNVKEVTVKRHLARVKLQVQNKATGAALRARYFEIPVLFNTNDDKIEMCNNEVNIGDACQAMGFRWDTSTIPPKCTMTNACLYGGAYTMRAGGSCVANPATGDCTCPQGPGTNYQAIAAGSVNIQRTGCFKGCDPFTYDIVYQCFWCPQ